MLERFEVKNFMGFSDWLKFDLTARDYGFNQNLVYNGLVNKAIVYGKNGIGKSALGLALFDIITHLTEKHHKTKANYRNLDHLDKPVQFRYRFRFGNDRIVYAYDKLKQKFLVKEFLSINNKPVIDYDYFSRSEEARFVDPALMGTLNYELLSKACEDNALSVLKYIYRSSPINPASPLTKLMHFCDNMLWYRSLSENSYMGFTSGGATLTEVIRENNKLKEFEEFLRENGLNYQLGFEAENDQYTLYAYYNNGKNKAPFVSLASTGTGTLLLYFAWSLMAYSQISFLFIDEFDAFLHYESAEMLVRLLNENPQFQSVLTTHNTYLMQNRLTRPDCCFLMSKNKITNLYDATDREIREAHNLEKMYINGAFVES